MTQAFINKCIHQDRAAQKQLYLDHCHRLMGIAYRYAVDVEEAKDIVQNSFIRIFSKLETFDVVKGNFSAWSKTICIREAIAIKRKNSQLIFTEDILQIAEREGHDLEVEDLPEQMLKNIMEKLPENHKTILMLYYFDEYSHKEVAEILDIKESSSRSKLTRAKTELTLQWKLANK